MSQKFNEHEFIKLLKSKFSPLLQDMVGIGDDCSVRLINEDTYELISTDMLIEGTHFIFNDISPEDLAYKSLIVNLSDIAAMGGVPKQVYLSLGIPDKVDMGYMEKFSQAFYYLCEKFNINLAGGDTCGSKHDFIINITVLGIVEKDRLKLRSQVKKGDILCLTGQLAESSIGLGVVLGQWDDLDGYFRKAHYRPRSYLEESRFLSCYRSVHGMMDLSDGLLADLPKLADASQVALQISVEMLPCSIYSKRFFEKNPLINQPSFVLAGGEEYSLLVSIDAKEVHSIREEYEKKFSVPLYEIGKVLEGQGVYYFLNDKKFEPSEKSFDHFS